MSLVAVVRSFPLRCYFALVFVLSGVALAVVGWPARPSMPHNTTYGVNVWMTAVHAVFVLRAYGRRQQIKGLAPAMRNVKNAGTRARPASRS